MEQSCCHAIFWVWVASVMAAPSSALLHLGSQKFPTPLKYLHPVCNCCCCPSGSCSSARHQLPCFADAHHCSVQVGRLWWRCTADLERRAACCWCQKGQVSRLRGRWFLHVQRTAWHAVLICLFQLLLPAGTHYHLTCTSQNKRCDLT